jgi:metallophosphoesterase (TIGR00282 family)
MTILYVGDVMGEVGLEVVEQILPKLRKEKQIDLVIAQAENTTGGKDISVKDYRRLLAAGVDFCTGGNWSLYRNEINEYLENPNEPIIRPANYPDGTVGRGWKYVDSPQGRVLVVSLIGSIVGRDAGKEIQNPLKVIDNILESQKAVKKAATVVNFHGDFSSEKRVIGYYLDGRVTAIIGDHWHVPTADAMVLPKGTAHITDVGMCGSLDSSIGVKLDVIINRWRDNVRNRNELEAEGRRQFNAVLIESDEQTGLAKSIEQIQKIF